MGKQTSRQRRGAREERARSPRAASNGRTGRNRLGCWIRLDLGLDGSKRAFEVRVRSAGSKGKRSCSRALFKGVDQAALAQVLCSLGHPLRLAIAKRLLDGPCRYGDLAESVGVRAGPLYHHISSMRLAGLISTASGRDQYELTPRGIRLAVLIPGIARLSRAK